MQIVIISNSDLFFAPAVMMPPQVLLRIWSLTPREKTIADKIQQFSQQSPRPIKYFTTTQEIMQAITEEKDAIFFLMGYPEKIKIKKLGDQRDRLFNIHFGPLPEYKGPSPVFWQIKENPASLGLCIHRVTEELDSGPVVWEKFMPNNPLYNFQVANQLMAQIAVEGIMYIWHSIMQGLTLTKTNRVMAPARYLKRPQAADIIIDWNKMTASEISALVRACNPWNKGAPCLYKGQQLNILLSSVASLPNETIAPGIFSAINNHIYVGCAHRTILHIEAIYWQESFWGTEAMILGKLFL